MPKTTDDSSHGSLGSSAIDADKKKSKKAKPMASMSETMNFVFESGFRIKVIFAMGFLSGVANGMVFPALAYLFSTSFTGIAGAATNGLEKVRELAFLFCVVGVYALGCGLWQTWCFEIVAYHGSQNFRLKWFKALLHQDPAFFDVYDIGGVAAQVGANANRYRRGMGRKFGEGIQFLTTGIGGLAFAFYSSWRVALVILAVVPLVGFTALTVMQLNQTKGSRAAASYKQAGAIAYSAVSSIKTVLSLNAVKDMIYQYQEATLEAFKTSVAILLKQGFANGCMLGGFFFFYFILTLYGSMLLYKDVERTGCDPSGVIEDNIECTSTGSAVFGAMLGVAFAAQGVSQVGAFLEGFATARVATHEALVAINRKPGTPQQIIYQNDDDDDSSVDSSMHSRKSVTIADTAHSTNMPPMKEGKDAETQEIDVSDIKAILPKYEINSLSTTGVKPYIKGQISLKDVYFAYPTRPHDPVLKGMTVDINPGDVVAFVGPSGGGKSTIVSMLERFYDATSGAVSIDGVNIKDINVRHLRKSIGYVGQEPTLFATTIRGNILYGNPKATQEQIVEAAKLANAHDFIMSFSDGYETQVGDKGSQLSGGQKQRIAIARILVGDPRILLLDEATSALDAESELVVQDALDRIVAKKKTTTIIIAHRLSTIRNADRINVIVEGRLEEQGTHDQLMAKQSYYRKLVEKQEGHHSPDDTGEDSEKKSPIKYERLDTISLQSAMNDESDGIPHIEFRKVGFSYPARPQKKIFTNFNLVIHQGETIALVGPSGGGKSTTVGLIERFYDPSEGQILYFGKDLKSYNVSAYRSQLSYVGQEPVLFNMTIAENITYGVHGISREEIEEAAKKANAHDFILQLPEGYDTLIGARGIVLSGGQKQRVAIARALVRKPRCLILDEATSALDNESESIVQDAVNKLMEAKDLTVVVIAHRLSTIRHADKIAMIAEGKVIEYGSHDELLEKPEGRYKRLFESSKLKSTMKSVGLKKDGDKKDEEKEEEEEINWEEKLKEEEEKAFDAKRARQMAAPDMAYIFIGAIGALVAGGIFPMMGVLFSLTISLLFRPVFECPAMDGSIPFGFPDCASYYNFYADDMRTRSYEVAGYWGAVLISCILGNTVTFWGFGQACERLNKRVRDTTFSALLRQEVGFFDKRSVGSITSQLQDDAARIHAFSGEPVRSFIVAMASLVTGVTLSFVRMWPFALLAIGCIPLMGFATSMDMKRFYGEDESSDVKDELNSPGGIIVETLLNIRTVSALTLESQRFRDYYNALHRNEPHYKRDAFFSGLTAGLAMFIQQWINALQIWFGSWLIFTFPDKYTFEDFLIANFGVLFALFGLGAAFQDMSDRKEVEKSAGRIFYLLDRKSEIDPLSEEGKKVD